MSKVAIVTGAGQGIGLQLQNAWFKVVLRLEF